MIPISAAAASATMSDDKQNEGFNKLNDQRVKDQAISFLNAFWKEAGEKAEDIFKKYQKFLELDRMQFDANNKDDSEYVEGKALNEVYAHKFLESLGKTLTAIAFRTEFKKIDLNFDKQMSYLEYLLYDHGQSVDELLKRPPSTSDELVAALEAYTAVEAELAKFEKEKDRLRKEAKGGGVKGLAAGNQLVQLEEAGLPEDLLKAMIKTENQVKKAQSKLGAPPGSVWWLSRELEELKKFKPKNK